MSNKEKVVESLYSIYLSKGYVTTDKIYDVCDEYDLSLFDTNYVANKLAEKGVLITDKPIERKEVVSKDNSVELTDYTQTDYAIIYNFFISNHPGMKKIIEDIKCIEPIQHREMAELIKQIRSGNTYAKEIAFQKNIRLALKMTYNYRNKTTLSLEDVFQEACIGIYSAIDSYNPYENSAFTSYCSTWIMQAINRFIENNEMFIRFPVHMVEKFRQIDNIIINSNSLSVEENIERVSEKFGISIRPCFKNKSCTKYKKDIK